MTDGRWTKISERLGNALAHDATGLRAVIEALPGAAEKQLFQGLKALESARLTAGATELQAQAAAISADPEV